MDRLKELRIDRSERPTKKSRGGVVAGFIALLALALMAVAWWWLQDRSPQVRVATVELERTGRAADSAVLDASGYVAARLRATISSKITGKIVEVFVEEGMAIDKGQLLARLDDATVKRQLALAEAQLAAARGALQENEVRLTEARLALRRVERLVSGEVASQADLDSAQANVDALIARLDLGREQVDVAERTVEVRRQDLADTEIRAPFSGVAVSKDAQPGEMISPVSAGGGFTRTGICTLVDMDSLEIEVDVNEAYINRVSPNQRVEATLDSYPDWRIPGSVITTVPTADRQKATVRVRIAFDELDPRILPDMSVKVAFLDEDAANEETTEADAPPPARLTIPTVATRKDGDKDIVFVLQGSTVERRAVRLGTTIADRVTVEAGLQAGEKVVTEGPPELADGDTVEVQP